MSETIRSILDSLPPADKVRLTYAFENDIPQHVVLPDGRYVGVYAERLKQLIPSIKVGHWSIGFVKKVNRA